MAKICFPHYKRGVFASLADALQFFNCESNYISRYALREIVQYNTCYRNHLRLHGVENLILRLIDEAPKLKKETVLLQHLREWATEEKLADYDIQCYNIADEITILGHTFNGLTDVKEHIELRCREEYDGLHCWSPAEVDNYDDVHIGHFYENYPVFDSYDLCDDRTYQNYIFRRKPITESDMREAFQTYHRADFCMVHENIPDENLPVLYYCGEGEYMLLATKRE